MQRSECLRTGTQDWVFPLQGLVQMNVELRSCTLEADLQGGVHPGLVCLAHCLPVCNVLLHLLVNWEYKADGGNVGLGEL